MRVRALKSYYYSRRQYAPGEELEMDDRQEDQARILATLGTLEIVTLPARDRGAYHTATIKAEPLPEPPKAAVMTTESNAVTAPRKQFYRRRDMRAKE